MAKGKVERDGGKNQKKGAQVKAETATPKSSSRGPLLLNIVIVLVSFAAGIVSPYLSAIFQEKAQQPLLDHRSLSTKTWTAPANLSCDEQSLSQYLHDGPVPGLHLVCWQDDTLTFYKNSQVGTPTATVPAPHVQTWKDLRSTLVEHLGLRSADDLHQPWAAYSPFGERSRIEVDGDDASIDSLRGMFLVYEGGQWIWPGVRKGFQREIVLSNGRNATLETISLQPLVLSVQGFLAMDECASIQETATPSLQYSKVSLMDKDQGRPATDFRTSQTAFLPSQGHSFLQEIEERTASLVRVPVSHQEHVQVLRYGHGEKYDSHHDYFHPASYQNDAHTLELIGHGLKNRMITVFWYLSDVAEGGETSFPSFEKKVIPVHKHCDADSGALMVKPQAGKVIIFYSQTPDGAMDPNSLHCACPVKEGTKWAANKWIWNFPMDFINN
jgi:prolyl 4-hydroxylase